MARLRIAHNEVPAIVAPDRRDRPFLTDSGAPARRFQNSTLANKRTAGSL